MTFEGKTSVLSSSEWKFFFFGGGWPHAKAFNFLFSSIKYPNLWSLDPNLEHDYEIDNVIIESLKSVDSTQ
jgi:hypothetical protein